MGLATSSGLGHVRGKSKANMVVRAQSTILCIFALQENRPCVSSYPALEARSAQKRLLLHGKLSSGDESVGTEKYQKAQRRRRRCMEVGWPWKTEGK